MRNISIDRQDKSRSGFRVLDSPSCHRPGDSEERTAHNDSSPSCTYHRSTSSCVYTLFSAAPKQKIMTMLMKRAKMMAVTPTLWGRMWGWEGSEVRGRGYFISPHNSPTPCTSSSSNTLVVVEHLQGLELHWQGRSPCRRKHRVRDFWRGRHPVFLLPGCSYHRISE